MKKIYRYITSSVTRQLFFNFIVLALVPLVTLQLVTIFTYTNTSRRMLSASAQGEVQWALDSMERVFSDVSRLCQSIQNTSAFQERMRRTYPDQKSRFSEELEADMDLASMMGGNTEVHGIYVLGQNELCCKSSTNTLRYRDFRTARWFSDAMEKKEGQWYGFHNGSYVVRVSNQRFISYCEPYINQANGNASGVVVVEIGEDAIAPIFNRSSDMKNQLLLLDENYNILYQPQNDCLGEQAMREISSGFARLTEEQQAELKAGQSVTLTVDGALAVCQHSPVTHWYLVGVMSMGEIDRSLNYVLRMTLGILMLALLGFAVSSSYLARRFTQPIIDMQTAMRSVEEGDLAIRLQVRGQNETAKLAASFNHMVETIQELMNSIYEKQARLRKLELRALQAQINPHFLYNSLDSIMWLFRMDRKEDGIAMMQNLAVLFRISLSKGRELIPVRSELQHLNSYISILSLRYSSRFRAQVEADESLYDCISLKLMLQPLVENSVYHGISVEKPLIHIRVSVTADGEDLLFCVEDDGAGMSPEQLENLRRSIAQPPDEGDVQHDYQGGGYGLSNVDGRIKIYFGQGYGLSIDSTQGVGTAITIRIPRRTEAGPDTGKSMA